MGFRIQSKIFNLVFENELAGLTIQVTSMPVGEFLRLSQMYDETGKEMAAADEIFKIFASRLLGWNLEDADGSPIPPTVDGLKSLDLDAAMAIIAEWINAMSGVSAELGKDSNSGATSPAPPLLMEIA